METTSDRKRCAIEGCNDFAKARGWCNKHWMRWWKYGSPIAGSTFKGDIAKFIEKTAKATQKECIVWPFHRMENGYGQAKAGLAHRLVCEKAHGAPFLGAEAAHSCGNGYLGCVNPMHLRWATASENMTDAFDHGTQRSGERHHWAKVPDAAVPEIIALRGVVTQRLLAERFNVSPTCIQNIQTGKSRVRNRSAANVS